MDYESSEARKILSSYATDLLLVTISPNPNVSFSHETPRR